MTFKDLKNTYRANEVFFSVTKQFGKTLNKPSVSILVVIFSVLDLFKVYLLANYALKRILKKHNFKSDNVGFILTKNQNHVLLKLRELGYKFPVFFFNINQTVNKQDFFISNKIVFLGILSNKHNAKILNKARNDSFLRNDLIRALRTIGLQSVYKKLLVNKTRVLNFNDHTLYNILLFDVAKKMSISTIYIQHAPVSYKFPALYHDVNILFSQDSADKYKIANNKAVVKIACDLRFLINKEVYKKQDTLKETILICTNALDSLEAVNKFVVQASKSYNVLLRPHPNDPRAWNKINTCKLSKNKSLWDDLSKSDIVVTNESGVVLEAMYLDKKLYKAAFFSSPLDNYAFLEKGLVTKEYTDVKSIMLAITKNKMDVNKEKLDYFIGNPNNILPVLDSVLK